MQAKGFEPVWLRSCLCRWYMSPNVLKQVTQLYGFRPMCESMWLIKLLLRVNILWHEKHCTFSFGDVSCTRLIWSFLVWFFINLFLQMWHSNRWRMLWQRSLCWLSKISDVNAVIFRHLWHGNTASENGSLNTVRNVIDFCMHCKKVNGILNYVPQILAKIKIRYSIIEQKSNFRPSSFRCFRIFDFRHAQSALIRYTNSAILMKFSAQRNTKSLFFQFKVYFDAQTFAIVHIYLPSEAKTSSVVCSKWFVLAMVNCSPTLNMASAIGSILEKLSNINSVFNDNASKQNLYKARTVARVPSARCAVAFLWGLVLKARQQRWPLSFTH